MSHEVLLKVAKTNQTQSIQIGDAIDLHGGPLASASGAVFLIVQPKLPADADSLFLHVMMNPGTPFVALQSVADIRVLTRRIRNEPVLSASLLK